MCGITVLLKKGAMAGGADHLHAMNEAVFHRGPDDSGLKLFNNGRTVDDDTNWNVGFAHRRLSILDLTKAGQQPMKYIDRLWITYNGEIYNYIELRTELKNLGHCFRTGTDTEVVLAAFAEWDVDCFRRFNGMWGMAIYDPRGNRVVVSRDRLGIKPVYCHALSDSIAVVSEIKQLTGHQKFQAKANLPSLVEFIGSGYEDSSVSFFKGVRPVSSGTYEVFDLETLESTTTSYWSPENIVPTVNSKREAAERFHASFLDGIKLRLRSDVPVGCFLSGGLDSSSIVETLSGKDSETEVRAFSALFPGADIDESKFVKQVLGSTGAIGFGVTPTPQRFREDLDDFVWSHDEPVGSTSVFASYCVARLARENGVKVILNGQGGDELFAGYWQSYYVYLWNLFRSFRFPALSTHVPGCLFPGGNSGLLGQAGFIARRYLSRTRNSATVVRERYSSEIGSKSLIHDYANLNESARRLFEMRNLFLPRLLKWDDRNTMAFSLEGRYPFLDVNLIETCLAFSGNVLYHRGWTKWPLRKAFEKSLPRSIVYRKSKYGFEVPQKEWVSALMPEYERFVEEDRPVFEIAERDVLQNLLTDFKNGHQRKELWQTMFRVFIVDKWMDRFSVSL